MSEIEELPEEAYCGIFERIPLLVREAQKKGAIVIKDYEDEYPEVFDIYGEKRPVLMLRPSMSVTSMEVYLTQAMVEVVNPYHARFKQNCLMRKKQTRSPFHNEEAVQELFSRIKFHNV